MLQVDGDFTSQFNFALPNICVFLVSDCYSCFFCVYREADLKEWVVIWSKIHVKLFFLKTSGISVSISTASEVNLTNRSFMNRVDMLQNLVFETLTLGCILRAFAQ